MLAHHSYSKGTPEYHATRTAFAWAAVLGSFIVLLLLVASSTHGGFDHPVAKPPDKVAVTKNGEDTIKTSVVDSKKP